MFDRNGLWSVTERHGHEKFGSTTLFTTKQHDQLAESCSRWSYSDGGPYCDSTIESENETYASLLIFKQ